MLQPLTVSVPLFELTNISDDNPLPSMAHFTRSNGSVDKNCIDAIIFSFTFFVFVAPNFGFEAAFLFFKAVFLNFPASSTKTTLS
jgi:hypothetical protein